MIMGKRVSDMVVRLVNAHLLLPPGVTPQPAPVVLDGSQIQKSVGAGLGQGDRCLQKELDMNKYE